MTCSAWRACVATSDVISTVQARSASSSTAGGLLHHSGLLCYLSLCCGVWQAVFSCLQGHTRLAHVETSLPLLLLLMSILLRLWRAASNLLRCNSGRIMHEEYDHFLTQNGYCRGNATLDSCYFEPLTRCRLTREEAAAAPTLKTVEQLMDPAGPRVGILDYNLVVELRLSVPKQFEKQVEERGIPSKRKHYWWRAQAIAYIIRPNARTRAELEKRKQ